jgi:histone-lysine N-methyltransferase SETMAR
MLEIYCETLNNLRRSIQSKWRWMLTKYFVLLHDNPRPRTATRINALIKLFNWEIFDHHPYTPNLAPSDCDLFTKIKVWLATQHYHSDEELMDGVNNLLHNLAAPFFDEELQNVASRYKCLNVDGNCVEK